MIINSYFGLVSPFFTSFTLDSLFAYCAYGGTGFYILRLLVGFGGGLGDHSMDSFSDHFSDDAFEFLSLNTLVGFSMMFGWGGLAASRQFLLSDFLSLLVGISCGFLFVVMVRTIFKTAKKLESSGSQLQVEKAVGQTGKVYQAIGENKRGVVQIILDDFTREFDAISVDNRPIASFQAIEVLKVIDSKTLVVKRIK